IMKTSTFFLTTAFGLLVSCSNVFSQKKKFPDVVYVPVTGYVINNKNDTIKCEFRDAIFGLKYKAVNSKVSFTMITRDNIPEYYTANDSSTYVAVKANERPYNINYLKRLEKGKINLYEHDIVNNGGAVSISGFPIGIGVTTTTRHYYIKKDDGP